MNLKAKIFKSKKFWLGEISMIDLITQGKTKEDAKMMIKDALLELLHIELNEKIEVKTISKGNDFIVFEIEDEYAIPFILKRLRIKNGLSIQNVCQKIGYKSKNGYAQYERGRRIPSIEQLSKFLSIFKTRLNLVVEST